MKNTPFYPKHFKVSCLTPFEEQVIALQGLPGVPKLKEGLNPATWMLQISTPGMEKVIGIDFGTAYKSSTTFRSVPLLPPSPPPPHSTPTLR